MNEFNVQVIYPIIAMSLLPFLVMIKMFTNRVYEMKTLRIHPQTVSTRAQSVGKYVQTQAADNFLNLFEMPVLFYLIGILFLICKNANSAVIGLMWLYVILRYIHSFIHSTYNKVMHRFYAFALSVFTLFILLITFLMKII